MSYIRSGSNVEGLYIWHDSEDKKIHVMGGLPAPLSRGQTLEDYLRLSHRDLHRLARLWDRDGDDGVKRSGSASVEERCVWFDTGERIKESTGTRLLMKTKRPWGHLVFLSVGHRRIAMWRVTWGYIVNNVLNRELGRRRRVAARRKP